MGRVHAVAVLALIAVGASGWLLLATGEQAPPPAPAPGDPVPTGEAPAPATGTTRSVVDDPSRTRPTPTLPAPEPTAPTAPPEPIAAPPTLTLRATDAATGAALPTFQWRWRGRGAVAKGDGRDGRADLPLPAGDRGELLVEAVGYQPFLRADVAIPANPGAPVHVDAPLLPTAVATGIALRLRDPQGQPIPRIRVDAFGPLAGDVADWHLGKPLWSRRTDAADGSYTLPELAPGRYGIRVLALGADTAPAPLSAWRHEFTLTGSNGFVEEIALEPACVLELELVDLAGNPVDPGNPPTVALSLSPVGGALVSRRWLVRSAGIAAIDGLPAPGTVTPEEPLPPGTFTLAVHPQGREPTSATLILQAGTQRERVVVR